MTSFVVDASVVIKWVVEEDGTAEALALQSARLLAPDLLVAECADILCKKIRRQEISLAEGLFAARLLQQADIEIASARPLMEAATRLAVAMDHPAYDCVYLALSQDRDLALVTADRRLVETVRSRKIDVEVALLPEAAARLAAR